MTEQHWNEFLEKLDFAQLTSRWNLLPLHWLDSEVPPGLEPAQDTLYRGLLDLPKELDQAAREEQVQRLVRDYRQARSGKIMWLDASLTPPGSRVSLRYLNPDELGQGDCLITVGSWDRLGHFIAEKAGLADEHAEPSENAVRKDPGGLNYRDLLLFPDKGTPSPRAFRGLCEKTLRQARGLGARRLAITHLHLPQPGLPDRFAAAEVVSAVRQMLREGGGISVEILPLTTSNYEDYRHWFHSLAELARGDVEASSPPPSQEVDPAPLEQPALGNALWDFAQKTSSLAQEAGRGVSSWFRTATAAATAPSPSVPRLPAPAALEPTFEDQQALTMLYLGRWKEAEAYRHRWEEDSLLGLYLAALYKVVAYLEQHPTAELIAQSAAKILADAEEAERALKAETDRLEAEQAALEAEQAALEAEQAALVAEQAATTAEAELIKPGKKKSKAKKKGKAVDQAPEAEAEPAEDALDSTEAPFEQPSVDTTDEASVEPNIEPSVDSTAENSNLPALVEDVSDQQAEPDADPPQLEPIDEARQEYLGLRHQLLSTAQQLGAENPLARYFQLLAWRLDYKRPDLDPEQFEEDHARLLRAAWAWDDTALLTFLRQAGQDQESEQPKAGYVPVFPSGSRAQPRLD